MGLSGLPSLLLISPHALSSPFSPSWNPATFSVSNARQHPQQSPHTGSPGRAPPFHSAPRAPVNSPGEATGAMVKTQGFVVRQMRSL